MKKLYSWQDVAKRTEIVYDRALKCSNRNLLERLSRYNYMLTSSNSSTSEKVPVMWSVGWEGILYGYDH
ncbi:hypothetical protein YC2023_121035 [Brassica napus]